MFNFFCCCINPLYKINEAPKYSMKGKFLQCKIIKVYDGDTVTIIFKPFNTCKNYYSKSFRLSGIDAPEIRTKNIEEKKAAIESKNYIINILKSKTRNSVVWIRFEEEEKYGRLMGHIYLNKKDKISLNKMLVNSGHAVEYNGGKKVPYKVWAYL